MPPVGVSFRAKRDPREIRVIATKSMDSAALSAGSMLGSFSQFRVAITRPSLRTIGSESGRDQDMRQRIRFAAFSRERTGDAPRSLRKASTTVAALPYLIGTMRAAGMGKTNALVRDALLNPERARVYLSKMPASADSGRFLGLASSIRRQLIGAPINLQNAPKEQRR
jgi:hypothetical protein